MRRDSLSSLATTADEDFAQSAKAAGVSYPELLEKLLTLGAGYQAEWRAYYG